MNLPIIPTIKSVTDLRYQTAEIISLLEKGNPVMVTRASDTVAIMLSPVQYQALIDLLDQIEDRKDVKDLESAIKKGDKFILFRSFDKRLTKK